MSEERDAAHPPLPLAGGVGGGPPTFRPRATSLAKKLRNNATGVERKLWQHLRNSQLKGFKFSRQMPVAGFVCDFLCRSARLVIELDGGQHDSQTDEDETRTRRIEAEGYRVIRFWNNDVNDGIEGVLLRISEALEAHPQPLPHAGGEFSA
ncbi:endonuclease domain-containing protein [Sphingomonadaceae bacterium G21617-S1]|nr:endonuclease domain-containing protein [Sphingomonadaceae bacterium G21617-S1]